MEGDRIATLSKFLFTTVTSSSTEEIDEATQIISAEEKNPDTIFEFFQILKTSENQVIKKSAAIQIMQMIRKNEYVSESEEYVANVKGLFIECLTSEELVQYRDLISYGANELLKQAPQMWAEYLELAFTFLANDETIIIGFSIISEICEYVGEDFNNQNFGNVLQRFTDALNSDSAPHRIAALDMMFNFAREVDPALFSECEGLVELLVGDAEKFAGPEGSEKESSSFFSLLSSLVISGIPLFTEAAPVFFQLGFEVAPNQLIPLNIRSQAQPLLTIAPCFLTEENCQELIPSYLEIVITVCGDLVEAGEEITFLTSFITSIITTGLLTPDIVQQLLQLTSQAIEGEDINQVYVMLTALIGIPAYGGEEMVEYSDDIIEIIKTCSESEELYEVTCRFITEIAEFAPAIYSEKLDFLIELLNSKIDDSAADENSVMTINTMSSLLKNADEPYSDYNSLLERIISLVEKWDETLYATLFTCVASCLSKIEDDQEIYEKLGPILAQFLETTDEYLKGQIFECYKNCVRISPLKVAAEVEQLISVLLESFSEINDSLNENITLCIGQIVKSLPEFIKPILGDVIGLFNQFLSKAAAFLEISSPEPTEEEEEPAPEEEGDDDDDENDPTVLMLEAVTKTFALIISEFPADVQEAIPEFIEKLVALIQGPSKAKKCAISAVFYAYEGLAAVQYDAEPLYNVLFDELYKCSDISIASDILLSISGLFISYGPALPEEQLQKAVEMFGNAFSGELSILYSDNTFMDPEVYYNLFFALRMFIFSLGERIGEVAEALVEILTPHISGKKKMFVGYVLHTFASLIRSFPQIEEVPEVIQTRCFEELSSSTNSDLKNLILSALNMLVASRKDIFSEEEIQQLLAIIKESISKEQTQDNMMTETAVTLWCTIITTFGITPDQGELAEILEKLPPPVDDDDIPFVASFFAFSMENFAELFSPHALRIGVNILASGTWLIRLIDPSVLALIANLIKDVSDEDKLEALGGNQHSLNQINANIAKFI